jgi:hypothetical protein
VAKWTRAVAKCHYGTSLRRPNPGQRIQFLDGSLVQVHKGLTGPCNIFGANPTEREVRRQPGQCGGAHSGYPIEPLDAAERPPALAIRHNPARQCRPNAWEPLKLPGAGPIGVDPLAGGQRLGEGHGRIAMRKRVAGQGWVEETSNRRPGKLTSAISGAEQVSGETDYQQRHQRMAFPT